VTASDCYIGRPGEGRDPLPRDLTMTPVRTNDGVFAKLLLGWVPAFAGADPGFGASALEQNTRSNDPSATGRTLQQL